MAATMINGDRRVTLPEEIRRDLGLEDGVEYVVERSGEAIGLDRARAEQLKALEVMLASRRHFPNTRVLTDDDWDRGIGEAIAEDFRSENSGDDAGDHR